MAFDAPKSGSKETLSLHVLFILWAAIFSSTFLFLVVLLVTVPDDAEPQPLLLPLLGVVALGTASLAWVLPKAMFRASLKRLQFETQPAEGLASSPGGPSPRVPQDPARAFSKVLRAYLAPFVLGLSLAEAITLYGFVLGMSGFPLALVLPFFIAGWGLLAMRLPNRRSIQREVRQVTGIHFEAK